MKEHETPVMPIKNRIALFAVEYGTVERDSSALVVVDRNGMRAQLPVGATAVLMLEPGTSITHEAVKLCAEARTLIIWTGEAGVRLYSAGQEGAANSYRLLRQARLALNEKSRLAVAREMYRIRFGEEAPQKRSIQQLRGMEGARVRARYKELSAEYGVVWNGRNYDRSDWKGQDSINRAVSAANSCLYGLCHAAILIAGYSAAIGFIHTGYPLAFVHDLADIWKMELAVECAFKVVAQKEENVATRVRHILRDEFRARGLLDDIIPRISTLLDAGELEGTPPEELAGTRDEPVDPWDAPWYRTSTTGEKAPVPSIRFPEKPPHDEREELKTSAGSTKEPDEGEAWGNEMFGQWNDPWKESFDSGETK
ncbi:MAG: type I-E CRISPR-associated endonuclease Cas1 [Ignavibacteriae bacterium]|nr:type I-E CRISPR-associated endonuclease Cas1 [Ignavibacteriota bacterium]MCB9216862.1 type I-E CRISPR-associated endonuclease Cas1 [Ignavibacteria bacterium]